MPLTNAQIEQHLPLVKWTFGEKIRRVPEGLDADELLAVGQLGLVEAARNFDETRGLAFSTYAVAYISGSMRKMIERHITHAERERNGQMDHQLEEATPRLPVERGARKTTGKASRQTMSLTRIVAQTPDAAEVGKKVADLRRAVFATLTPERLSNVIARQLEQAEEGDVRSARLILGLVSMPSVSVQQVHLAGEELEEVRDAAQED